jgi:HPt (histidine-containing phosphotransfer) domain-containing protein
LNKKESSSPHESASGPSPAPEAQSHEQKLQAMLSALWDRSRHTVAERAALLQSAVEQLAQNRLDEATQLSAVDSAHKLAGVLGTFGLPRGTDLAREAELLFGQSPPPGKVEIERLQLLLAELTSLIERGPVSPR